MGRPAGRVPASAAPSTGGASRRWTVGARGTWAWMPLDDARLELRILGPEHAPGEHDVDVAARQVQAADDRERPSSRSRRPAGRGSSGRPHRRRRPPRTRPATGSRSRRRRDPLVLEAIVTSIGGRARSGPGRGVSSAVRGPRPSRARTAAPRAAMPRSPPPPQSPEMSPSAASRAVRPSAAMPAALTPGAADHADAPAPLRAGPDRREGVVHDERVARPAGGRERAGSAAGRRPACRHRRACTRRCRPARSSASPAARPRLARRARRAGPCPRRGRRPGGRWSDRGRRPAVGRRRPAGRGRSSSCRRRRRGWRPTGGCGRSRPVRGGRDLVELVDARRTDAPASRSRRDRSPATRRAWPAARRAAGRRSRRRGQPSGRRRLPRWSRSRRGRAPSPRRRRASRRADSRRLRTAACTRASTAPAPNGQRNHGRGSTPVASSIARPASAMSSASPSSLSSGIRAW